MYKVTKLAIDIGHCVKFDGGAVGIRREDDLNYEVGMKLVEKCRAVGIEVVNCTPCKAVSLYDALNQRVTAANSNCADFFISIHHNACPGGEGTEILCIKGGKAEEAANIILPEIVKLGFRNRGVKDRRDLFVINKTRVPAILIECAFCDSAKDMQNYDTVKMAEAIFNGICKAFDISSAQERRNETKEIYYTVVKGDTLGVLARRFGTTIQNIAALNNIENVNLIVIGQKLKIK